MRAFESAGGLQILKEFLDSSGVSFPSPAWLYGVTTVLSNLVSNVPAVMLLLPLVRDVPQAGYILAVSSTFAGNLLIVGSIANIIVAGEAERMGIPFDWKLHALVGSSGDPDQPCRRTRLPLAFLKNSIS